MSHPIPLHVIPATLAPDVPRPRLVPRVYAARPATEFQALAYRLRKAILADNHDALLVAARAMTSEERLKALEQFEADDIRKGFWDPEKRRYSAVNPRPLQERVAAPAKKSALMLAPQDGSGPRHAMQVGMVAWVEFEGERRHVRVTNWGPRGAQGVDREGNVIAIVWKDFHAGVHPEQLAEHQNLTLRRDEEQKRRAWALMTKSVGGQLYTMSPAQRALYLEGLGGEPVEKAGPPDEPRNKMGRWTGLSDAAQTWLHNYQWGTIGVIASTAPEVSPSDDVLMETGRFVGKSPVKLYRAAPKGKGAAVRYGPVAIFSPGLDTPITRNTSSTGVISPWRSFQWWSIRLRS